MTSKEGYELFTYIAESMWPVAQTTGGSGFEFAYIAESMWPVA